MTHIEGNIIELARSGNYDVIAHGCNCFCKQKSGLAPQMVKAFRTNEFLMEKSHLGDINKLGQIDYNTIYLIKNKPYFSQEMVGVSGVPHIKLYVVNAYTQFDTSRTERMVDYDALTLCMRKINHLFKFKRILLPRIGCGLGKGDWSIVEPIIEKELNKCDVTIVHFKESEL